MVKISKKKIEELREDMKIGGAECYGTEEVVLDTATDILKGLGSEITCLDEIGLTDGDTEFATWDRAVDLFLNFIDSEGR